MPESQLSLPAAWRSSRSGAIPLFSQPFSKSMRSLTNSSGKPSMMASSLRVNLTPTHWTCVDRSPFFNDTLNPSAPIVVRIMAKTELRSLSVPWSIHSLSIVHHPGSTPRRAQGPVVKGTSTSASFLRWEVHWLPTSSSWRPSTAAQRPCPGCSRGFRRLRLRQWPRGAFSRRPPTLLEASAPASRRWNVPAWPCKGPSFLQCTPPKLGSWPGHWTSWACHIFFRHLAIPYLDVSWRPRPAWGWPFPYALCVVHRASQVSFAFSGVAFDLEALVSFLGSWCSRPWWLPCIPFW